MDFMEVILVVLLEYTPGSYRAREGCIRTTSVISWAMKLFPDVHYLVLNVN